MTDSPIAKVIARINAVYGNWKRDTTVETMRADWDALYGSQPIAATTEDLTIAGMECRWVAAPQVSNPAVVLYIHGGGFRLGSITSHLGLMSDIACAGDCKVLGFNYRLMPAANYPAPLEDTLAIYQWLLDQGYSPDQIIVAGDSAGGGLAAALLQKIRRDGQLPEPAGLILLSAWLDMTLSGESYVTREASDPVHQTKMLALLAKLYGGEGADLNDPLLSPLAGNLDNHPPVLLQIGDCEVGLSDSISYAEKVNASGGSAELSVWPEMIHVFQMFSVDLPEAREALSQIGAFIQRTVNS